MYNGKLGKQLPVLCAICIAGFVMFSIDHPEAPGPAEGEGVAVLTL